MHRSSLLLLLLPALAAGSESSGCYTLTDSPGCSSRDELGVSTQASAAACQTLCDADCTCVSYEYWPDTSACQLSTSCNATFMNASDGSTWQLYLKNESCWCSPPPTSPPSPGSPPAIPPPAFPPPSAPGVCPNASAATDLEVSLSPSTVQLDGATTPITVGGCALAPGDTVALVPKTGYDAVCDVLVHVLDGEALSRGARIVTNPPAALLRRRTAPHSPTTHPRPPPGRLRRRFTVQLDAAAL